MGTSFSKPEQEQTAEPYLGAQVWFITTTGECHAAIITRIVGEQVDLKVFPPGTADCYSVCDAWFAENPGPMAAHPGAPHPGAWCWPRNAQR
jgi:hypothetical protein